MYAKRGRLCLPAIRPEKGLGMETIGHKVIRAGLGALASILLVAAASGTANAQGTVRSVHDDWQIRCENPPGAQNEQCALFQSVVAEDRANVGLTVLVLKTA